MRREELERLVDTLVQLVVRGAHDEGIVPRTARRIALVILVSDQNLQKIDGRTYHVWTHHLRDLCDHRRRQDRLVGLQALAEEGDGEGDERIRRLAISDSTIESWGSSNSLRKKGWFVKFWSGSGEGIPTCGVPLPSGES